MRRYYSLYLFCNAFVISKIIKFKNISLKICNSMKITLKLKTKNNKKLTSHITNNYNLNFLWLMLLGASPPPNNFSLNLYLTLSGGRGVKNVLATGEYLTFLPALLFFQRSFLKVNANFKKLRNLKIKKMLRTFFGLKPKKIRTFEGFSKVLCFYKTKRVEKEWYIIKLLPLIIQERYFL